MLAVEHTLSPTVAGRRAEDGWRVAVVGPCADLALTPMQARRLARELMDMCDVIDGTHPAMKGVGPA